MNLGGPATVLAILADGLRERGWEVAVLAGRAGPGEVEHPTAARGVGHVRGLGPEIRPLADAGALARLVRALHALKPAVVHTHTAKAGLLGRLAALSLRPRPVIVHTYHGHVLEGYFGPLQTAGYRWTERALARRTDALVGVSAATVDDLLRLGVGRPERFHNVPIGFDAAPLLALGDRDRATTRAALGVGDGDVVALFAGRLVPIKRVDVLLAALARTQAPITLVIAGDGSERARLEAQAAGLPVRFLGYRDDLPALVAGADLAVLSSDNEGTPVFLMEAAAAGVPAVATAVGGVAEVVADGRTGWLVGAGDSAGFARALDSAADPVARAARGRAARDAILSRYDGRRLVAETDALYTRLLAR